MALEYISRIFILVRGPNGRTHPLCESQRIKVGRNVWLGFVIVFHRYDYFSFGMFFFDITDSLSRLA